MRQADHFELVRHRGTYRCAGVQGSIASFPCDVLIVDDPYKDHLEARTVVREAVWNNFVSVLLPRLQEGRGVLICSTRWHQDDLVGRLIEREPEKWRVMSCPAIAEDDEPHRLNAEPLVRGSRGEPAGAQRALLHYPVTQTSSSQRILVDLLKILLSICRFGCPDSQESPGLGSC